MKLVKRILAVVLSLCVVLALSACAGKPRKPSAEDAEKHVRAALDLMCTGDFDHSVHLAEEDELKTTAEPFAKSCRPCFPGQDTRWARQLRRRTVSMSRL